MGQKLIPLPATLLLPKSLEGSPKEGTLPEGQLWHARWAESRAQLFHPFRKWLMVRKCQMRQSKTLWHFYFQSGGKKKKQQPNKAALAGCHSLLGPASALAGCMLLPAAPWHGA